MTIKEYFQGIFSFPVSDDMVQAACLNNEIDYTENVMTITTKEKELCLADLLIMLSRASQTFSNKTASSNFSMTLSGEQMSLTDRKTLIFEANNLYLKNDASSKIKTLSAINI